MIDANQPSRRFCGGRIILLVCLLLCATQASVEGETGCKNCPADLTVTDDRAVIEHVSVVAHGDDRIVTATNIVSRNSGSSEPINYGDHIYTSTNGKAQLAFRQDVTVLLYANAHATVRYRDKDNQDKSVLKLLGGLFGMHHKPIAGEVDIECLSCNAYFKGTEIVADIGTNGAARFWVLDGKLIISNHGGTDSITNGQGVEVLGISNAPTRLPVEAKAPIQWMLYYPAVVVPEELGLSDDSAVVLRAVVDQYRRGDVLKALWSWPETHRATTPAEQIFRTALELSVGQTTNAMALKPDPKGTTAAEALRVLAAVVAGECVEPIPDVGPETRASVALAVSYYRQSKGNLAGAREAAYLATRRSRSGYALTRLAELEFSFGNYGLANRLVEEALTNAPNLAPAHAMRGFLQLAMRRPDDALTNFNQAVTLDPGLGNALLGRGLAKIQLGQRKPGLADIMSAVVAQPDTWLFRAYLAKGYSHLAEEECDPKRRCRLLTLARHELELAKLRDPNEPTAWFYSALEYDRLNRPAAAIEDLQDSIERNANRALYRSNYLLDQDAAVRSANLANLYARAGMTELSLREAAKAVAEDYSDASAHAHLAASFNELRDPTRFNLRHEEEWFNEHLLSTLLSPVGVGSLSQRISPNEYSRLFNRDGLRLESTTEYLNRGELRQGASQSGTFRDVSYAVDLDSQFRKGQYGARDLERIEVYTRVKGMLTPRDTLLVLGKYMDYDTGDFSAHYDPTARNASYRLTEQEKPLVLAGWHHEWSPEQHTLLLGGRLEDRQQVTAEDIPVLLTNPRNAAQPLVWAANDLNYTNQFEAGTVEVQHLSRLDHHSDILGVRYQQGSFEAWDALTNHYFPTAFGPVFASQADAEFSRLSAYAYHTLTPTDGLWLTGGFSFDDLTAPANYRRPPVTLGEQTREQWSPKASIVWTPAPWFTLRALWARALGGVSYDESIRLEPTQLAGFSQSFRSLVDESLVGSVELPTYETAGIGLDFRLGQRTFLGLAGERHATDIDRTTGYLDNDPTRPRGRRTQPAGTLEQLGYAEHRLTATLDQILAEGWFAQAQYRVTDSSLNTALPQLAAPPGVVWQTRESALMHELHGALLFRHPCGFFSRIEAGWYHQQGMRAPDGILGPVVAHQDELVQFNGFVGWEFPRRRAEVTVGVLNATGADYRFSPLTVLPELPREALFYTRLRLNF
jgi:tetratricopeptide (TPR) repeat protein